MSTQVPSDPTVSVVIPAYNSASLLPEAIESVLDQTYSDFELIVVDDGSTDETPQVMEQYEGEVRYIRKENAGSASARNRGIREASGEFIAFLDADEVWFPEKLERQVKLHRENPDLMWSYTNWLRVDLATGEVIHRADQVKENPEGDIFRPLLGRFNILTSTQIFRQEVFEDVGTYDESELLNVSEDVDLELRVAERYPVGYIDSPLAQDRCHDRQKTSNMDLDHALRSRHAVIERAIERNPDQRSGLYASAFARNYTNIGRKWLERQKRRRALEMFASALQHSPTYWSAWMYAAAACLPEALRRLLGRVRKVWRRQSGDGYSTDE